MTNRNHEWTFSSSVLMLGSGHMILKFITPTWPKMQVSGAWDGNSLCVCFLPLLKAEIPKYKRKEKICMLFQRFSGFLTEVKVKVPGTCSYPGSRGHGISMEPSHSEQGSEAERITTSGRGCWNSSEAMTVVFLFEDAMTAWQSLHDSSLWVHGRKSWRFCIIYSNKISFTYLEEH